MPGVPVAMILSAGLFGVGHLYQESKRAIMMGIYGWLLGWLAQQKKSIHPGIFAHGWQDSFGRGH
jgi:membrane protease YdiL (CAAX protease family)